MNRQIMNLRSGRPAPSLFLPGLVSLALVINVLFGVAVGQEPGAQGASAQPRIHVDAGLIDLGKVREGRIGEAVFAVENRGDAPLEIIEAKTTCTCMSFELPQRILQPGERIFIPAKYVTTGHMGKESGAITLTTNDPINPRTQLVIHVDIDSVYEMEPLGRLILQPQRPGLPCEPSLRLLPAKEGSPLRVLRAEAQRNRISVRHSRYERDGRVGEKLTVIAPPTARKGTITDALIITIQVGDQKRKLRVPVQLPVLGEVHYEPRVMARMNAGWRGRMIGTIQVRSVSDKPLELLDARAEGPIDITVNPAEPQRTYEIQVSIAGDAPSGPFGSMVTILTDNSTEPIITVPVFGIVQPWIRVTPPEVFMRVSATEPNPASAEVILKWPVAAPVKLAEPVSGDPRVRAELIPGPTEVSAGIELATATLRIGPGPSLAPGRFNTTIRVVTGWENHPTIEVPVFVRVK